MPVQQIMAEYQSKEWATFWYTHCLPADQERRVALAAPCHAAVA